MARAATPPAGACSYLDPPFLRPGAPRLPVPVLSYDLVVVAADRHHGSAVAAMGLRAHVMELEALHAHPAAPRVSPAPLPVDAHHPARLDLLEQVRAVGR